MSHPTSLQLLQSRKFKITRSRRAIIELLETKKKPLTATEIGIQLLQKFGLAVNKTTIYRELSFLLGEGIIKSLRFNDRQVYYEAANLPHHHHLVCTSCNQIREIAIEESLAQLENTLARTNHFKISRHILEFFGLCQSCNKL